MGSAGATLRKLLAIGRRADPRFRARLVQLALFALIAGLFELAALGSLLPLLAMLAEGRAPVTGALGSMLPGTPAGMVLLFAAIVSMTALVRLALTAAIQRGVLAVGHAINISVQRRLLDQPYLFHAASNSSRFVAALQKSEELALGLLRPLVQGFAGMIIGAFILAFLVAAVGWPITLGSAAVLGGAYFLMSRLAGQRLARQGADALAAYEQQVRLMMESSGAIRDILLDHRQRWFAAEFEQASQRMARARAGTDLLAQAPRFLIEALGAIAFAALAAVIAARDGGIGGSLALFGMLALAMVRIVPLAQLAYSGWTRLATNRQAVEDVGALLDLPERTGSGGDGPALPLTDRLTATGLGFTYPGAAAPVLAGADLEIAAGEWVGLSGATGAGKSTLGDLLMGLLVPDAGTIAVDGRTLGPELIAGWQRSIGHVSQSTYLVDDSIAANIALAPGAGETDLDRIAECARLAQLDGWIAGLPEGFDTAVGERGRRLSGGQRQRIAIARALYKGASLLVLDEATNALDPATERALLDRLRSERPGLTVLLISHRPSTLERCDRLLRIEDGRVLPD